jgi:hypothetical protein
MFKEAICPTGFNPFELLQKDGDPLKVVYPGLDNYLSYLDFGEIINELPTKIIKKDWGCQGVVELAHPYLPCLNYNGRSFYPRMGFALIQSADKEVSQNFHSHPSVPEVIGVYVIQGGAYLDTERHRIPLRLGGNVLIIPSGQPHDICLAPNSTVVTCDVKSFDPRREDNLEKPGELRELGTENNFICQGQVMVETFPFGLPVAYNPSKESVKIMEELGYNAGLLVSFKLDRLVVNNSTTIQLPIDFSLVPFYKRSKYLDNPGDSIPAIIFPTFILQNGNYML